MLAEIRLAFASRWCQADFPVRKSRQLLLWCHIHYCTQRPNAGCLLKWVGQWDVWISFQYVPWLQILWNDCEPTQPSALCSVLVRNFVTCLVWRGLSYCISRHLHVPGLEAPGGCCIIFCYGCLFNISFSAHCRIAVLFLSLTTTLSRKHWNFPAQVHMRSILLVFCISFPFTIIGQVSPVSLMLMQSALSFSRSGCEGWEGWSLFNNQSYSSLWNFELEDKILGYINVISCHVDLYVYIYTYIYMMCITV